MQDTKLFETILGIQAPWTISRVALDTSGERVDGSDLRYGKPRTEAFAYRGGRVVYLIRQGATLQAALKRAEIFDCALATIIWHEMAHIDGADEVAAQEAEEQLWREFIVSQRVDRTRGMRYLALLEKRRAPRQS